MVEGKSLFRSKGIWPAAYQAVLDREFSAAWHTWEPETLWAEILRIWHTEVSGEVMSKIMALKTCITTDLFYTDAPAFENMALAVNDMHYDPTTLQVISPEELVYAVRTLSPVRDGFFNREVVGYIRVCCRKAGLLRYPESLRFAEPEYPAEQAALVEQISSKSLGDKEDWNVVAVQSNLLHQIDIYVAEKLAQMKIDALQPSTA